MKSQFLFSLMKKKHREVIAISGGVRHGKSVQNTMRKRITKSVGKQVQEISWQRNIQPSIEK
jgi:hypothetical protein